MLEEGFWILDPGCWILVPGLVTAKLKAKTDAGCWMLFPLDPILEF